MRGRKRLHSGLKKLNGSENLHLTGAVESFKVKIQTLRFSALQDLKFRTRKQEYQQFLLQTA